jgi:chemotaxis protein methyltransferase CheR
MTVTQDAYEDLREWVGARTGLTLTTDRCPSVEPAIRRAMARTGQDDDVLAYRRLLETDPGALDDLLAELTVGETYFFREPSQFQFIRHTVLPEIRQRRGHDHVVRAWSAGCASGEEAYSLAILLLEEGLAGRCRLLATDLSRATLIKARRGTYSAWSLRGEGALAARPYLHRHDNHYVVDEVVRRLVTFDHANLVQEFDHALATEVSGMDLILCRNVFIYFDQEKIRTVARRLRESLAEGGWLITASTDPPLAGEAPFEVVATDHGLFYRNGARPASRPIGPASARPEIACAGGLAAELATAESPAVPPAPLADNDGPRNGALARELPADWSDAAREIRALANLDVAEAERVCAAATQRLPLSSELHYLRAVLLLDLGRDGEAIEAARRAIYLDRSLAIAHLTVASILRNRGDREGAWRAYRNARDLCRARPAEEIVPLSDGEPAGRLLAAAETQMALIEAARMSHR